LERLRSLLTTNLHFTGVIIFFLLHGYRAYRGLIPLGDVLLILGILLAAGFVLFGLTGRWFKSYRKAGFFTSVTLVIILFFGAFQDFLSGFQLTASLSRLVYFVPVCGLLLLLVIIWIRRARKIPEKVIMYVNVLLILYLLIEAGLLLLPGKRPTVPTTGRFIKTAEERPPVYLVILDEYMGTDGLAGYFGYNNRWFEDSLKEKGFHVVAHSQSNYQFTLFSMASLLSMEYPAGFGRARLDDHYAYAQAMHRLRNNAVTALLAANNYRIANFSGFDLAQAPAYYSTGLLPDKGRLLTSGTLWYRIGKYLPTVLMEKGIWTGWGKKLEEQFIRNNESAMQGVLEEASKKDTVPAFTYLHLMMPHLPFAFDSTGRRLEGFHQRESITPEEGDQAYLQYLVYTNRRILKFLGQLKKETGERAVILLMSDHGARGAMRKDWKYAYLNFNAVYLPDQQYAGWYDGMTSVNQFRVLFNTLFHENLPMLKDSLVR